MPRAHRSETIHFSALAALALAGFPCLAQQPPNCGGLPNAEQLRTAVQSVVKEGPSKNGGMGCAIVFSGTKRGDQWPGSRVIAASKASTANALSGANYALSTANLYAAAQPGGSLYGLVN